MPPRSLLETDNIGRRAHLPFTYVKPRTCTILIRATQCVQDQHVNLVERKEESHTLELFCELKTYRGRQRGAQTSAM